MGHFTSIPVLSVLVAALSGFVIGGLWYGPVFRKPWMKYSGMSFERGKQQKPALVFGGAYVLNVVAATRIAFLLPAAHSGLLGVHVGAFAGLLLVGPALGVIYLFESRPWQLWLINTGYQTVNFAAMGAIIGVWK